MKTKKSRWLKDPLCPEGLARIGIPWANWFIDRGRTEGPGHITHADRRRLSWRRVL